MLNAEEKIVTFEYSLENSRSSLKENNSNDFFHFQVLACESDSATLEIVNAGNSTVRIFNSELISDDTLTTKYKVFSLDKKVMCIPGKSSEKIKIIFNPIEKLDKEYTAVIKLYVENGSPITIHLHGIAKYYNITPSVYRSNKLVSKIETEPQFRQNITINAEIPELPAIPIDSFAFTLKYSPTFFRFDTKTIYDINNGEWNWTFNQISDGELKVVARPQNSLLRKGKIGCTFAFTTYADKVDNSSITLNPEIFGPSFCFSYSANSLYVHNNICFNPGRVLEINDAYNLTSPNPNPVKDELMCKLTLAFSDVVDIEVFDQSGRPVKKYPSQRLPKGESELRLDGKDLPNGFYILRVSSNGYFLEKRLIISK